MAYTAPSIAYSEVSSPEESPREAIDDNQGFRATRTLMCDWGDRLTLANQLLGAYRITSNGRTYLVGDNYPHRSRVYASQIPAIRPFGKPTKTNVKQLSWEKAILSVEYRERGPSSGGEDSSGGSVDPDPPIAEESLDIEGRSILLPSQKLYWAANIPVDEMVEAPSFNLRFGKWIYTYSEEGDVPSGLMQYGGYVNSVAVESLTLGITFPAETLLYLHVRNRRTIVGGDAQAWRRTLEFAINWDGWNLFPRSGYATPQPLYQNAAGTSQFKPYRQVNFATELGV